MAHLFIAMGVAAAVASSAGCGVRNAPQERPSGQSGTSVPIESVIPSGSANTNSATISVPQNPADLGIRRDLNLAIARDSELRDREISYIVANGDVSLTGIVHTEEERQKMNDLAMNIGGVKSVANALRVGE